MEFVLAIHEVDNYVEWKHAFDKAAQTRKQAGEISYQIFKYENAPNKIVHLSTWSSLEEAKAFYESPELIEIRKIIGAKEPEFIYLDQLEKGAL